MKKQELLEKPRLILNADDFGRTNDINKYIADHFISGCISSASIMANGDAFEEACHIIHQCGLSGEIGVHLALDEVTPLSEKMKKYANQDGKMCFKRSVLVFSTDLRNAIHSELCAQVEKVLNNGIRPTHLDSHHHVHTSLSIGKMVFSLSKQFNIAYVRRARDLSSSPSFLSHMYNSLFNSYLSGHASTTDVFCDLAELYERWKRGIMAQGTIECMCHFNLDNISYNNTSLFSDDTFKHFLSNYKLINFTELIRGKNP